VGHCAGTCPCAIGLREPYDSCHRTPRGSNTPTPSRRSSERRSWPRRVPARGRSPGSSWPLVRQRLAPTATGVATTPNAMPFSIGSALFPRNPDAHDTGFRRCSAVRIGGECKSLKRIDLPRLTAHIEAPSIGRLCTLLLDRYRRPNGHPHALIPLSASPRTALTHGVCPNKCRLTFVAAFPGSHLQHTCRPPAAIRTTGRFRQFLRRLSCQHARGADAVRYS
jgi:hypothetical protein